MRRAFAAVAFAAVAFAAVAFAAVALGFESHLWPSLSWFPSSFPLSLTPISRHSSPVLSNKAVKMPKKREIKTISLLISSCKRSSGLFWSCCPCVWFAPGHASPGCTCGQCCDGTSRPDALMKDWKHFCSFSTTSDCLIDALLWSTLYLPWYNSAIYIQLYVFACFFPFWTSI